METLAIIAVGMQVVGSISAGYQQAAAMEAQADMYMKQAKIYGAQIEVDEIENERRIALEKAATAQESLDRTDRLRRIIGSTIAAGAQAGISTQYGTITSLNEYSSSQAASEEAIAQENSRNRIVSLNLNSAINQNNYANQAAGSVFNAGQLKTQASQAVFGGYMNAASSLVNYGMRVYDRGSVPSNTTKLSDGNVIRWVS